MIDFEVQFVHIRHCRETKQDLSIKYNIRQIRKFLTSASTKLLIQGVIMARIDYCNGLLYGVTSCASCSYHPCTQILSYYPSAAFPALVLW